MPAETMTALWTRHCVTHAWKKCQYSVWVKWHICVVFSRILRNVVANSLPNVTVFGKRFVEISLIVFHCAFFLAHSVCHECIRAHAISQIEKRKISLNALQSLYAKKLHFMAMAFLWMLTYAPCICRYNSHILVTQQEPENKIKIMPEEKLNILQIRKHD